jgi:hypothetical protein
MSNFSSTSSPSSPFPSLKDSSFPYMPPSIRCQPIIDYTNISFHDSAQPLPIKLFDDSEFNFGIFNLQIRGEIPIIKNHLHIFFTIDSTGSMQDPCADGRTKMQHILYTLENMLHVFHETSNCEISVHVQSFNTQIYEIISNINKINTADINLLVQQIKKIRPNGATNIECALRSASQAIANYKSDHPNHDIAHIFLTDGEITDGSNDFQLLQTLVPNDCSNIFIGYGIQHDSHLLSELAINKNNEYRFIDALEKAGLVYGEIIHGLLYKAISEVVLVAHDCEIYDYLTNTWTSTLEVGNLLSEQNKIYHLRSKTKENSYIKVMGKTMVQTQQFEEFTDRVELQAECHYKCLKISELEKTKAEANAEADFKGNNLIKYVFRQRTQELLFEARKVSEKNRRIDPMNTFYFSNLEMTDDNEDSNFSQKKDMKRKLKDFHTLLLNYIQENQLETDAFLKTLCDDIYIAHKTAGTPFASMFTTARQTSQGRQQTYNCSALDTIKPISQFTNLARPNVFRPKRINRNLIDQEENIDNYQISHDALSPYSTLGVVSIMRGVSGDDSIGEDNPTLNLEFP